MNLPAGRALRRLFPLLALGVLVAPGGGAADLEGGPPDGFRDTGERFFHAASGKEFRVLREDASGRKALLGPDGSRYGSVREAVLKEEAGLSPLRLAVHPALWPAVEDPARAGEMVRVVLVLRDSPLREAADAARERAAPAVEERFARLRDLLGSIGARRDADPDRLLQIGHRMEEEARLLTAEERAEARRLRTEIQDRLRTMRREALDQARPRIQSALDPVEAAVARLPGARILGRSLLLAVLSAEVPAGALEGILAGLPQVGRVLPHETRRVDLSTSVTTIGAATWAGAGYDGSSSTKVAVLDTGIDAAHPALSTVIGGQAVFLSAAVAISGSGFADNASSTDDIFGHGTHCAGIVMSQDATYKGVAPGGVLLNGKCGYRLLWGGNYYGSLEDADIMAAGDWAATQGADVFSCSFGGGGTTDGSSDVSHFFDAAADALGLSVAVAAGNSGPSASTVGTPGDGFNVVTVGAFNDNGTTTHTDNSISSFSSRGPLSDGRRKPDLAAPGSQISSCNPAWEGGAADFVAWDGTSMATPHVAGAMALLLDYAASWSPEGVKALLAGTTRNASPYPSAPDQNWGTGGLDLAAAFAARASVLEGAFTNTPSTAMFVRSGSLASGKRATLCWNREVLSNGSGIPVTYRSPADLDLSVYEESNDSLRGASTSALDSIEQVAIPSASTFPILKVKRIGSFPAGQTAIRWAVATEATTASRLVTPPALSCAFTSIPALVGGNRDFTVVVTVTNSGELPATTPAVSLALPAGYSIASGTNPLTIGTIPAVGDSRTATWTVTSASSNSGTRTISATATTNSFQETFTSATVNVNQSLDAAGPVCTLSIEAGRVAADGQDVSLRLVAIDDLSGVVSMRFRNQGGSFGAWVPYALDSPWTLEPGEGIHVVEGEAMDAAGNVSSVATDDIVIDTTAPTGSFTVNGDAEYAMPWEDLGAQVTGDDGVDGSGVVDFRSRPQAGVWTEWVDLLGGNFASLERPALDGRRLFEGQVRDAAGNASATATDAIYLVEGDAPPLTAVKSWKGTLSPGGDIDAFRLDALAGDVLTVSASAKPADRGADFGIGLDLVRPSGQRTTAGLDPKDPRKSGLKRVMLNESGVHWIVVRPTGDDRAVGAPFTLSVKLASSPENRRREGATEPAGDPGVVSIPFLAAAGSTLGATLTGTIAGPVILRTPEGDEFLASSSAKGGTVRLAPLVLDGGTGEYVLLVPSAAPVGYRIDLKPAKKARGVESIP